MSFDTTKSIGRDHLLKGAAALGALAALGATGIVKVPESEAASPSLVGAWMTTNKGAGDVSITAFTKDGLVIDSGSVAFKAPAPSGNSPITIGLGTWVAAASGGFDVTFSSLGVGTDGALQGVFTITAHAVLGADGNSFHASYKAAAVAGGKVMYSGTGSVTGTRMKPAM